MDPGHLAHLGCLCAWAGVLLVEFVIESIGQQRFATRWHFWIDVAVEIPLVAAVLVTGGALLARSWPPAPLLVVKIASALLALGLNLYCSVMVICRYRARTDAAAVDRYDRRVRLSAIGVPFGLFAAYLGLAHFM